MRDGERENEGGKREMGEVQGALKKHSVLCWQAFQLNPLAVRDAFFFLLLKGPAFAI